MALAQLLEASHAMTMGNDRGFKTWTKAAEWINVVGLVLLSFMLLSYIVLPAQSTRSHYLSVCLVVAVAMITIGFVIPLGAQPTQCFNEITPNDMFSSMTCAWSGAMLVAGALTTTMWIFIRALSMHLQICWDIVPGKKFFYGAQTLGWGIPAVLFIATVTATGVSFRNGNACHVNHEDSMKDFWGPLLGFAALAMILQLATFGYCIHVYLKNLWSDDKTETSSSTSTSLPSYTPSAGNQTARAVYARLKKVVWLQWRGLVIVTIVLVDVVTFAVVFLYLDDMQAAAANDFERVRPWLVCLVLNGGDKNKCLIEGQKWLINEATVVAILILLSIAGLEVFLLLFRRSTLTGWKEFFRSRFSKKREFVSLDALSPTPTPQPLMRSRSYNISKFGHPPTTFEMQTPGHWEDKLSPNNTFITSPTESYASPIVQGRQPSDYFSRQD
ncbi:hypothetical protein B0A49_06228, partial [Cryomyces minteri]